MQNRKMQISQKRKIFAPIEKMSFTRYERLSLCRDDRRYSGLRIENPGKHLQWRFLAKSCIMNMPMGKGEHFYKF